jgi:uncharacterized protein (DUF488 family)
VVRTTGGSPSGDADGRATVFTIGHGARTSGELVAQLRAAGVGRLVDVRTAPGSRKHPQFGKAALEETLGAVGIEYAWRRDLGGWRRPVPDSPHVALRSPAFRGYADHMDSPEFAKALDWLIQTSARLPTAVMCAESLWWRCHRRMVADALVARGCEVLHIMGGSDPLPHRIHPAARLVGTRLVYDVVQPVQQELPA